MSLYQQHITTLQNRFDEELTRLNYDGVLIYSGQHAYAFLDDNSQPFKVNPYFKYWLPLTKQQKSFLHIRPGRKPHLYLFQEQDYWHAQPVVPEGEWQEHFELTIIDNVQHCLNKLQNTATNTAIIGEAPVSLGLFSQWPVENLNPKDLLNALDYFRAYKTEYEIENMRQANTLAAKAHIAAKNAFFAGKSEIQVHQAYLEALAIRETALPYNNIIAFNNNASVLHYDDYQTVSPDTRRSFLIDAGAEYNGYNADISRTYINTSAPDGKEFQQLFEAYQKEYYALLDEISIGKPYLSIHDSAHRRLSNLLAEFDLVNCSGEDAYVKGYSQLVFPCGVGHYIGAQVHDVGGYLKNREGEQLNKDARYPFLRLMRPIEENIVITIEPGIYLIDQLLNQVRGNSDFNWSRIEQFKPFGGFRLEDCLAITKDGVENLSSPGFE